MSTVNPGARRARIIASALAAAAVGLSAASGAFAQGGVPFDEAYQAGEGEAGEGAVWDLSEPVWIFFAQQRLLAPETPMGEAVPRAAFAHLRPAGESGRLFFIVAGIAYLGLYHAEFESLEVEASLFTMLVPLGSNVYLDGRAVEDEEIKSSWTDASLRALQSWSFEPAGRRDPVYVRIGGEYQIAFRNYVEGDETDPAFVLPDDTAVETFALGLSLDTRGRGPVGDHTRGFEIALGATREVRTDWNAWGAASGSEYTDPDAERATTAYASVETHHALDGRGFLVLHTKLRAARGRNLDRLTYIRVGGGGFGRQFDRVGAGSTGAANDGELFRSDGVPGYFGGEYMTDEFAQLNLELDIPGWVDREAGSGGRAHVSAAWARLRDVLDSGERKDLVGFGIGYTRVDRMESAWRIDLGYSPRPDGAPFDSGDVTFTYIKKY